MRQKYMNVKFHSGSLALIQRANEIITEYGNQGYVLTIRQLYYQLVARDVIPNNLNSYKRLASIMNDARLAGLSDWDAIEDRTREFVVRNHWNSPGEVLRASAEQYHEDLWASQPSRVFVIVEKEALVGVLERVCYQYDIPLLAARGYPSVTVLRDFAISNMARARRQGQKIHVLHLGDHDPSGIDMTRDLVERISMFHNHAPWSLERIALNMDQIEELDPPENPAKTTDARFDAYMAEFGSSSWELDALPPDYINQLVKDEVDPLIDWDLWDQAKERINNAKERLLKIADDFDNQ